MLEFIAGALLFAGVFYWSIHGSRKVEGSARDTRYKLDGEGIVQYLGPINWLKNYGIDPGSVCDIKFHPTARSIAELPGALRQSAKDAYLEGFAPGPEMSAAIGREEPLPAGFLFHFVLRKQNKAITSKKEGDTLEMWVVAKQQEAAGAAPAKA